MPSVVHYWTDLQSVRCYGNITRTIVTACVHPAIWRHSANARRGLRALLAGDRRVTGDVLNITVAAWTAGFHWWRSGDITRTQDVSEYMLVLALCLVMLCAQHACAGFVLRSLSSSDDCGHKALQTDSNRVLRWIPYLNHAECIRIRTKPTTDKVMKKTENN